MQVVYMKGFISKYFKFHFIHQKHSSLFSKNYNKDDKYEIQMKQIILQNQV